MDDSLAGSLAGEGPVSFIALLDAFLGQIIDVLYGDKLRSYFLPPAPLRSLVPGFLLDSSDFRLKLSDLETKETYCNPRLCSPSVHTVLRSFR
jgi:hypothetical protein